MLNHKNQAVFNDFIIHGARTGTCSSDPMTGARTGTRCSTLSCLEGGVHRRTSKAPMSSLIRQRLPRWCLLAPDHRHLPPPQLLRRPKTRCRRRQPQTTMLLELLLLSHVGRCRCLVRGPDVHRHQHGGAAVGRRHPALAAIAQGAEGASSVRHREGPKEEFWSMP
jgi:hypothetical protein